MAPPNALHIVLGEVSLVVTALRRSGRWQNRDPHATMIEEAQVSLFACVDSLFTVKFEKCKVTTVNLFLDFSSLSYDLRHKYTFTCHITFERFPMTKSKK